MNSMWRNPNANEQDLSQLGSLHLSASAMFIIDHKYRKDALQQTHLLKRNVSTNDGGWK